jgi:small subunit ribosomal protein S6
MRHYEIVFMAHPDQSDQIPAMLERYKSMIEKEAGSINRLENWGRRPLAYLINKLNKAHYVLMNITCNQTVLDELVHNFRFSDAILRHLIILRKKPITEASYILKPREHTEDISSLDEPTRDINRYRRKKQSILASKKLGEIDYKNPELLKACISETGRILPSRITGTPAKLQRQAALAVKRARFLALLPYCDHH